MLWDDSADSTCVLCDDGLPESGFGDWSYASDQELVSASIQREDGALGKLIERCRQPIFAAAAHALDNRSARGYGCNVQELVNEFVVELAKSPNKLLGRYDGRVPLDHGGPLGRRIVQGASAHGT